MSFCKNLNANYIDWLGSFRMTFCILTTQISDNEKSAYYS